MNAPETIMEHRTLRQRDDNARRTVKNLAAHFQNMKNLQANSQTNESYDNVGHNLPPPVRITPYSGVKPKDTDLIRPVAFRPYVAIKAEARQTVSSSTAYCNSSIRSDNLLTKRLSNSDDLKRPSQQTKDAMPNSSAPLSSNNIRPRGIYQPSTSSELVPASAPYIKANKFDSEENDYDVVPEYIERDKFYIDVDSTSSENYSLVHYSTGCHRNPAPPPPPASLATNNNNSSNNNRNKIQQHNCGTTFGISATQSPQNIVKKSQSSHQVYGSNASSGSRHSSGIHITPSPSDSGIVDYETIIRDKENELTNVRATMEQNEEVVVRVYLEKERLWKEQLADLKHKLQVCTVPVYQHALLPSLQNISPFIFHGFVLLNFQPAGFCSDRSNWDAKKEHVFDFNGSKNSHSDLFLSFSLSLYTLSNPSLVPVVP
ncbi:unnamed protein product [Gongylonema pulchrum]|uniref:Uncharacterized protein n=1 Tax=Gongylonema pulchrum TaxID=637853 RepID=A0A3P7MYN2_9BILA|nr:unnamed protein product [Gongylonema pulchrum]